MVGNRCGCQVSALEYVNFTDHVSAVMLKSKVWFFVPDTHSQNEEHASDVDTQ